MNPERQVAKFVQRQVVETVHGYARSCVRLTHEMAQDSQMRQTYDTTSPNRLDAASIPYTDEALQGPHKATGEYVQGVNQMEA